MSIELRIIEEPVRKVLLPTHVPGQHDHGFSRTPTYAAWCKMIQCCTNIRHRDYPRFGGRGVKVCFPWLSFKPFLRDMGPSPDHGRLTRIDDSKGFEPGNCVWAA